MDNLDLAKKLKNLGVYSLVVSTDIDSQKYPYSGKQMVIAKDRLCQHIELRAATLDDFIDTAERFWNALAKKETRE